MILALVAVSEAEVLAVTTTILRNLNITVVARVKPHYYVSFQLV